MKGVRIIGIVALMTACSVTAAPEASALFATARQAVEQGRYTEALQTLAQIQFFIATMPNGCLRQYFMKDWFISRLGARRQPPMRQRS